MTDVGTLDGAWSEANGINKNGDVTGGAARKKGLAHAFVFHSGRMKDLGSLGPHGSEGWCINDRGDVAGSINDGRGFFWRSGKMQALHLLDEPDESMNVEVKGLNNQGTIIGTIDDSTFWIGFLWRPSGHRVFGRVSGAETMGYALNNRGDYVWAGQSGKSQELQAFLQRGRRRTVLHPPSGWPILVITAMNDRGILGGFASYDFYASGRPVIIRQGHATLLPFVPGYPYGTITGINAAGTAVGEYDSDASGDNTFAFVFNGKSVLNLNHLVKADSGWRLDRASGINDRGQIVGTGRHAGQKRGFILTPL